MTTIRQQRAIGEAARRAGGYFALAEKLVRKEAEEKAGRQLADEHRSAPSGWDKAIAAVRDHAPDMLAAVHEAQESLRMLRNAAGASGDVLAIAAAARLRVDAADLVSAWELPYGMATDAERRGLAADLGWALADIGKVAEQQRRDLLAGTRVAFDAQRNYVAGKASDGTI